MIVIIFFSVLNSKNVNQMVDFRNARPFEYTSVNQYPPNKDGKRRHPSIVEITPFFCACPYFTSNQRQISIVENFER
jgi:hypothetical protein